MRPVGALEHAGVNSSNSMLCKHVYGLCSYGAAMDADVAVYTTNCSVT